MKFIDEYRDPQAAARLKREIERITTRPWTIMEICGGQTHAIVKNGIDLLLPENITLLHGPGCPVCVTSVELIDKAVTLASRPDIIFCSFGDMLRVPGTHKDLLSVKAEGGDVRMVYSPLDALKIARENSDRQVVFFGIGFETTAPANVAAILQARQTGLTNFSMLMAIVLVKPAMAALLSDPENRVQAFLAAGHVCAVTGYADYESLAATYHVPMVVTGFEPLDILQGIYMTIAQLEQGRVEVENQYTRAVRREGNLPAIRMIEKALMPVDRKWRGLDMIPASGLGLRPEYIEFDAERRFGLTEYETAESPICISGLILQGRKKPHDCPAFGTDCTPEHPLGATMVSSEGACAAYYRYRRTAIHP
ncbi:MAG: hydrogenase formation protein HypD [candidate division Zixibacteria bacterium]|nr:hydrogenase formation protein HypD [candidate division Zixibacteria bacterium]